MYEKYVAYVTRLQTDLDCTVGNLVPLDYRAQVLSYEDFCRTWQRWGKTAGVQETWRSRFDLGYDRVAADLCERLESALTRRSRTISTTQAA
jgi:hypothetical protein